MIKIKKVKKVKKVLTTDHDYVMLPSNLTEFCGNRFFAIFFAIFFVTCLLRQSPRARPGMPNHAFRVVNTKLAAPLARFTPQDGNKKDELGRRSQSRGGVKPTVAVEKPYFLSFRADGIGQHAVKL